MHLGIIRTLSLKCVGGDVSRGRRDKEGYSLQEHPHLTTGEIKICKKRAKGNSYRERCHGIQKKCVCQGGIAYQQN